MYKRKCNKPFTNRNSHQTTHYPDPAIRGSSNNTLLKQALCDDNLDKALDWLRHSESHNQFGQRQVREIRSAEDRILKRAFSQVLTPIVQAATPTETVKKWGGVFFIPQNLDKRFFYQNKQQKDMQYYEIVKH